MEHFWAQKCKNTKISQNLFIRFFEVSHDSSHSKWVKSYWFFSFQDSIDYAQRIPVWMFSGTKLIYFLYHCFVFPGSFTIRIGVYCYIVLVINVSLCTSLSSFILFHLFFAFFYVGLKVLCLEYGLYCSQ